MNTTFIKQTIPTFNPSVTKKLCQLYLGLEFTGTPDEQNGFSAMLYNKQGSLGVEEILCKLLGYHQSATKHGFDGMNSKGELIELKPSTLEYPTARYNDVTTKKLDEMLTPKNKVVFETHLEGRGVFIGVVDGTKVQEMLEEKYEARAEAIRLKKTKGTRQSHGINLTAFVKRFGASAVTVMLYVPHPDFQKSVVKDLKLSGPVNNLPKL